MDNRSGKKLNIIFLKEYLSIITKQRLEEKKSYSLTITGKSLNDIFQWNFEVYFQSIFTKHKKRM